MANLFVSPRDMSGCDKLKHQREKRYLNNSDSELLGLSGNQIAQDVARRMSSAAAARSGRAERVIHVRYRKRSRGRILSSDTASQAEEGLLVHERRTDRAAARYHHDNHADVGVTLRSASALRFPQQHDHQPAIHE